MPPASILRLARVGSLVLLSLASGPAPAAGESAPERLRIGGHELVPCSSGTRAMLLVDLYRVTFYASSAEAGLKTLQDPEAPRAVWVELLFPGGVPDRRRDGASCC